MDESLDTEREQGQLAELLNRLLDLHRRPDGRRWSDAQIADWCASEVGTRFSRTSFWQLRTGRQRNMQVETATALARFFDVDVHAFANPAEALREMRLTNILRDSRVESLALRGSRLSTESLTAALEYIEELERREVREG